MNVKKGERNANREGCGRGLQGEEGGLRCGGGARPDPDQPMRQETPDWWGGGCGQRRELAVAWSRRGGIPGGNWTERCGLGRNQGGHKVNMGP